VTVGRDAAAVPTIQRSPAAVVTLDPAKTLGNNRGEGEGLKGLGHPAETQ